MHMLKSSSNLMNVLPNLLFRKRYFIFLSSLHNELKISFFSPFDCNK